MGQFTAYSLYTAVVLLAGYLVFKWLMAREKQIVLNRVTILGIYAMAFLAMPASSLLRELSRPESTGELTVVLGDLTLHTSAPDTQAVWPAVFVWVYFAGMAVTLIHTIVVFCKILHVIRSGSRISSPDYPTIKIIITDTNVAPFSWANCIVMSREDYEKAGEIITAHECAHIEHRHWIDLLVAQAVCVLQWFNPASWLLLEELKSVHEYQADESVLAGGADARNYQMLLVKKAVGSRFRTIANSLNHSNLKKRISMMCNPAAPMSRRLRGFALVPALALAIAATDLPAVASVLHSTGAVVFTKKASHSNQGLPQPEIGPQYPGGEQAMWQFLSSNIRFPREMREKEISGRVTMRFRIETDGSLSSFEPVESPCPQAEAEVIRVLRLMPRWTPGCSCGNPTACNSELSVAFVLSFESSLAFTPSDIRVVGYGTQKKSADTTFTVSSVIKNEKYSILVNDKTYTDCFPADFDPKNIHSMHVQNNQVIIEMKD